MKNIMKAISDTINSLLRKHPEQWTLSDGAIFIGKILLGFAVLIAGMLVLYAAFRVLRKIIGGTKKLIFGKNRRGV